MGMKTAISIPDSLFDAADRLAQRLGISRSQLYSTAVSEYLEARRAEGVTERLDAIYSQEESCLDPALLAAQLASIPEDDWPEKD